MPKALYPEEMPYRIDLRQAPADALDRLVELGALDVDVIDGGIAAIMPDSVRVGGIERALGCTVVPARARGRDDESVWVVRPRPVQIGRLRIVPADGPLDAGALRIVDGPAFGTGLHPTTALCLEALDRELAAWRPEGVLDVGTGSGVLALAALASGVPRAVALDIDGDAVRTAAENARLNGLSARLGLVRGGPEALSGSWPLVLANVLAAPLIAMAPTLARRVGRNGPLVLSGIRASLAPDVEHACLRVGLRLVCAETRDDWTALTFHASW